MARAFVQGLRTLGYVEGQNLILERRSAEGRPERFGDLVAELVRLKADVIVTYTDPLAQAAKAVTTTVPIVMASSSDPVGARLVRSLARPRGNITGVTIQVGPEIEAKRLELLRAMLPGVSRVAYLANKEGKEWESPWGKSVQTAARALGVTLVPAEFTPHQYAMASRGSAARGPRRSSSRGLQRPMRIELSSWTSRPGLGCQACSSFGSRWNSGV